jgi:hypothetical protein
MFADRLRQAYDTYITTGNAPAFTESLRLLAPGAGDPARRVDKPSPFRADPAARAGPAIPSRKRYASIYAPATLKWIDRQIQQARQMGFDYFKLDFLSAGAMEGKHHDPEIRSGIQAYNRAMQFIVHAFGPDKFISLSIAPMFPSQYGHSRRVSCDIYSQLTDLHWPPFRDFGSTEYMLSCDTFLWWMAGRVYAFNDPDEIVLTRSHAAMSCSRNGRRRASRGCERREFLSTPIHMTILSRAAG